MKTLYEKLGGTYREENGYFIPDIELPEQKEIGNFGLRHLEWIEKHHKARYNELLMSCKLNEYLVGVDEEANERFDSLVADFTKAEGVDENLKATDQMKWVQMMNNIVSRVKEIVGSEVIYA